jgi:benzoate-CoA ligase
MLKLEFPDHFNVVDTLVDSHLVQGRGHKAAILCGQEVVTYRDLFERVNRVGNFLRNLGVRTEERVAILVPDSPECVYAFFGAMKIGAVSIPINTNLLPEDYEYLLNDCRARVLIVHASLLSKLTDVRTQLRYVEHLVVTGDPAPETLSLEKLMAEASPQLECADTRKDDAAFWLYSSGTTGSLKGTVHLHHDMIVAADLYAKETIGLQESDVSFSIAKLFFAYGLGNGLYFPLRVGATTILLPERPLPDVVFDVLDRYHPTVFYGVPTSYAALLHTAEHNDRISLGRVRMCISAGEPLPRPIFEKWHKRFGVEILDGIGSTEILHIFISNRPGRAKAGSTGEIVPGYEARIVDDDNKELPVGETGSLLI